MTTTSSEAVFRAVAEPNRRRLFERLAESERSVGDLVVEFQLSQPLVSKHLGILRLAGLVRVRSEGRRRLYRADPAALRPVGEWAARFERYWRGRLADIKADAERHHRARGDGAATPADGVPS